MPRGPLSREERQYNFPSASAATSSRPSIRPGVAAPPVQNSLATRARSTHNCGTAAPMENHWGGEPRCLWGYVDDLRPDSRRRISSPAKHAKLIPRCHSSKVLPGVWKWTLRLYHAPWSGRLVFTRDAARGA